MLDSGCLQPDLLKRSREAGKGERIFSRKEEIMSDSYEQTAEVRVGAEGVSARFQVQKVLLALQHLLAMFGATVLVPILTGLDTSVALFSAGVGTLLFHWTTKGKVPVFLGSSFAFIPVIIAVRDGFGGDLRYAQGGIIVAGAVYVLLSLVVRTVGAEKVVRFFPSQVVGPMIMVIGLNLIPVAVDMARQGTILAAVTLGTALAIHFLGKGFFRQMAIITAVAVGYLAAGVTGALDTAAMDAAVWLGMPAFSMPRFDLAAILVIAPVVLAVTMEHIGDITTNGAVVGKNFLKDPGLDRTLLGDGLATMFAGLVGGPANTTYGENTGLLAITKNYDPSILRMTAAIAIVLGLVGKVGGFLRTIPVPVMGGISLMLFAMIALIGVRTIRDSRIAFDLRNFVIMGSILVLGLGGNLGLNLSIGLTDQVSLSGLSLAALVGVVLNQVLYGFQSFRG